MTVCTDSRGNLTLLIRRRMFRFDPSDCDLGRLLLLLVLLAQCLLLRSVTSTNEEWEGKAVRLVTAWNTDPSDVESFLRIIKS